MKQRRFVQKRKVATDLVVGRGGEKKMVEKYHQAQPPLCSSRNVVDILRNTGVVVCFCLFNIIGNLFAVVPPSTGALARQLGVRQLCADGSELPTGSGRSLGAPLRLEAFRTHRPRSPWI